MERIQSFTVDHTKLVPGLYVSRTDGDITTFDLRLMAPNKEVLENAPLHTLEHLGATNLRNSEQQKSIIYFGPMGCRTGFYLLVKNLTRAEVLALLRETFAFIAHFTGEIPGASVAECGNWREHDLPLAKQYARDYLIVLQNWGEGKMEYTALL